MQPLYDKILVKRVKQETKSAGGIIIPGGKKAEAGQGVVIAIGAGHRNPDGGLTPLDIEVGDVVLFDHRAGVEIKFNGDDLLLLEESRILGTFCE